MTLYDEELLIYLKKEIEDKKIIIFLDNEPFINKIEENYSIGFSGINWKEYHFIDNFDNNFDNIICKILELLKNVENEIINVFGDGLIENCYQMNFNEFINNHKLFLDIPQNLFVYFINNNKCLNFTFKNEVFFG